MRGHSRPILGIPADAEPVVAPVPLTVIVPTEAQHKAVAVRVEQNITKEVEVSNSLGAVQRFENAVFLPSMVVIPEAHEGGRAVEDLLQRLKTLQLLLAGDTGLAFLETDREVDLVEVHFSETVVAGIMIFGDNLPVRTNELDRVERHGGDLHIANRDTTAVLEVEGELSPRLYRVVDNELSDIARNIIEIGVEHEDGHQLKTLFRGHGFTHWANHPFQNG